MKFLKFFILIFVLQLSSCRWFQYSDAPFLGNLNVTVPAGTPAFKQGFKDGCESVLYSRGNQLYRHRYGYKYDPKMIDNTEYRFGRSRGYNYCFFEIVGGTAMTSFDRYILPYGNDSVFEMGAGDVNDAWGGFFGGGGGTWGVATGTPGGFDSMFKMWSGGSGGGALSANPLWAGGSEGQIFGQ